MGAAGYTDRLATAASTCRHWRSSLYARASIFLALGAAAFAGALAVVSHLMVADAVERLLAERSSLAQMVGSFVQTRLFSNLGRLSARVVQHAQGGQSDTALGQALGIEFPVGLYSEGAFALDSTGVVRASAPAMLTQQLQALPLAELCAEADRRSGPVASRVLHLGPPSRSVLVMLQPLPQAVRPLGYVGGILPVRHNTALTPALGNHRAVAAMVDLIDRHGVVVASTDPERLLLRGDHEEVLQGAITWRRGFAGRCHGCHQGRSEAQRVRTVLAFATLPQVALGIAVQQPEAEALAPAFTLQRRLVVIGVAFVALFLVFAGLSVRSVVAPITRLTATVRNAETRPDGDPLPAFGPDEVGELAATLERWRDGVRASLQQAEFHRLALDQQMVRSGLLLSHLQQIAGLYTAGVDAQGIARHGLGVLIALLGYERGVLRVALGDREVCVGQGMEPESASQFLLGAAPTTSTPEASPDRSTAGVLMAVGERDGAPLLSAHHHVPQGICLDVALLGRIGDAVGERGWVVCLVHQIGVSAATRLLHDHDLARQSQQEQYLHRLMRAQEDERRRVARELHDTVAQDLAALRLQVERLASRATNSQTRTDLSGLELRVSEVLDVVRHTLFELRLAVLENLGWLPAIQWQLERLERDARLRCILVVRGAEREPPPDTAVALLRILQESLQNVVAHAHAEHVTVTVRFDDAAVDLIIEDDGDGFDLLQVRGPSSATGRGLGLLGMEERARLVGGQLHLESAPGEGTTVHFHAPLPPQEGS